MAQVKVTDLAEETNLSNGDEFLILDASDQSATKRVEWQDLTLQAFDDKHGHVAAWAEGDNTDQIPLSKITSDSPEEGKKKFLEWTSTGTKLTQMGYDELDDKPYATEKEEVRYHLKGDNANTVGSADNEIVDVHVHYEMETAPLTATSTIKFGLDYDRSFGGFPSGPYNKVVVWTQYVTGTGTAGAQQQEFDISDYSPSSGDTYEDVFDAVCEKLGALTEFSWDSTNKKLTYTLSDSTKAKYTAAARAVGIRGINLKLKSNSSSQYAFFSTAIAEGWFTYDNYYWKNGVFSKYDIDLDTADTEYDDEITNANLGSSLSSTQIVEKIATDVKANISSSITSTAATGDYFGEHIDRDTSPFTTFSTTKISSDTAEGPINLWDFSGSAVGLSDSTAPSIKDAIFAWEGTHDEWGDLISASYVLLSKDSTFASFWYLKQGSFFGTSGNRKSFTLGAAPVKVNSAEDLADGDTIYVKFVEYPSARVRLTLSDDNLAQSFTMQGTSTYLNKQDFGVEAHQEGGLNDPYTSVTIKDYNGATISSLTATSAETTDSLGAKIATAIEDNAETPIDYSASYDSTNNYVKLESDAGRSAGEFEIVVDNGSASDANKGDFEAGAYERLEKGAQTFENQPIVQSEGTATVEFYRHDIDPSDDDVLVEVEMNGFSNPNKIITDPSSKHKFMSLEVTAHDTTAETEDTDFVINGTRNGTVDTELIKFDRLGIVLNTDILPSTEPSIGKGELYTNSSGNLFIKD